MTPDDSTPGPVAETVPETPMPTPATGLALSVVVPLHNEEDNVDVLHRRLNDTLGPLQRNFELVFVDDGSTDATSGRLAALADSDERLQVLRQDPCQGKARALDLGLGRARGDVLVLIDADLQFPPEDIPKLLDALEGGADVVSGARTDRKDPTLRRLGSWLHNRLVNALANLSYRDHFTGMLCLRRSALQAMDLQAPLNRFPLVVAARRGLVVREVPIHHQTRVRGHSSYTLLALIALALSDLLALWRFVRDRGTTGSRRAS